MGAPAICPNPKGFPLPEDRFAAIGPCESTKREITLCYQTFGDTASPPILLVSGLGCTCFSWRENLCEELVRAGYFVIRYDNRDVGLSTHLENCAKVALPRLILPVWASVWEGQPPYLIDDMARDGLRLLTALGIKKAHIMGSSMGGMIVQAMAIQAPERILSATIIFSHSGQDVTPQTWKMSLALLDRPASTSEDDVVAFKIRHAKRFCGGYSLEDPAVYGVLKLKEIHRAPDDSDGISRQAWAIRRSPGRDYGISKLSGVPVLIVHGMQDTMIPLDNGLHLAELIPDAKLVVYPRMGHYIPVELYKELTRQVAALRADNSIPERAL